MFAASSRLRGHISTRRVKGGQAHAGLWRVERLGCGVVGRARLDNTLAPQSRADFVTTVVYRVQ